MGALAEPSTASDWHQSKRGISRVERVIVLPVQNAMEATRFPHMRWRNDPIGAGLLAAQLGQLLSQRQPEHRSLPS